MHKCSNCGLELTSDTTFCPQCGSGTNFEQNLTSPRKRMVVPGLHDEKEFEDIENDGTKEETKKETISESKKEVASKWVSSSDLKKPSPSRHRDILKPKEKPEEPVKKQEKTTKFETVAEVEKVSNPVEEVVEQPKVTEPVQTKTVKEPTLKEKSQNIKKLIEKEVKEVSSKNSVKNARNLLLGNINTPAEPLSDEVVNKYSEEAIVGSSEDAQEIQKREAEREAFRSKQPAKKRGLFKPRKGLFSSMFSGFADEAEDEQIRTEISKDTEPSPELKKVLKTGREGRSKKKDNNKVHEEERADKIHQTDKNEDDYDNYYEFVMPSDNLKYESKSSFKVHFIGFGLIIIGAILVFILIARSGFTF